MAEMFVQARAEMFVQIRCPSCGHVGRVNTLITWQGPEPPIVTRIPDHPEPGQRVRIVAGPGVLWALEWDADRARWLISPAPNQEETSAP